MFIVKKQTLGLFYYRNLQIIHQLHKIMLMAEFENNRMFVCLIYFLLISGS